MTLSAREMTPLAGSGNAVQYGVGVATTEVGGFHNWRLVRVPGEGDMTFEAACGGRGGGRYGSRFGAGCALSKEVGTDGPRSGWAHATSHMSR
jgi:hypothetical protein